MSYLLGIILVLAFIAGVLLLEGAYLLWNDAKGPDAKRLERRLRMLSAGTHGEEALKLLRRSRDGEAGWVNDLLLRLPKLERILEQAGVMMTVSRFASICVVAVAAGVLLIQFVLQPPLFFTLGVALLCGALPVFVLFRLRAKRLGRIEQALPDAVDLISRAMRAGHAFPSALQMVGSEMTGPIATEFRIVSEEVNYGVAMDAAFQNLATRVPSDDMRFFVIAVLLQRETGGNLAEVLRNISALIRERFHLFARVKVLSAEGKLSAIVLGCLPLGTALALNAVSPKFMSLLWTDPFGLRLVYGCLMLMAFGIFWMWRIVKIRV
jgi:tight adherence protein B